MDIITLIIGRNFGELNNMSTKKTHCPHCHKELNLGSLMAHARWNNKTKKQKLEQGKMLTESRVKKTV